MKKEERVKQILESVRFAELEVRLRKARADELEARCRRLTAPIGARSGGGGEDRGELLALWADARTQELEAARQMVERRKMVEGLIARVRGAVLREILTLRYLTQLTWRQVQLRLQRSGYYYSERNLYYLHRKALAAAAALLEKMQYRNLS